MDENINKSDAVVKPGNGSPDNPAAKISNAHEPAPLDLTAAPPVEKTNRERLPEIDQASSLLIDRMAGQAGFGEWISGSGSVSLDWVWLRMSTKLKDSTVKSASHKIEPVLKSRHEHCKSDT